MKINYRKIKEIIIVLIFMKICISQGSVATQLRCGVIFSNHFITSKGGETIFKVGGTSSRAERAKKFF